MKILIVANYNKRNFSPFVIEQANSLKKIGIHIDFFGIVGKGLFGYLKNRKPLINKIKEYEPDLIHAHYGLSGLLANLQRVIPVITTFHGSDIHSLGYLLKLSRLCMRLSKYNIFVSRKLYEISEYKLSNFAIQPCGINIDTFHFIPKEEARKILGWDDQDRCILFAGSFDNYIKNPSLAQEAVSLLKKCRLIELRGYRREEVNTLMNACDCLLLTSHREASPMVIKEAMVCGCAIVSVNVGDVKELITGIDGCYIAERTPEDIADKISHTLVFNKNTNGYQRVIQLGLDDINVAKKIIEIYHLVLAK